ncbi:MAG: dephospho-CoA kinase, partial [Longimicrobiales bacterium]
YGRFLAFDALGVTGWALGALGIAYLINVGWELASETLGVGVAAVLIGGLLIFGWRLEQSVSDRAVPLPDRRRARRRRRRGVRGHDVRGWEPMVSVALTGSVASGKSAVAEAWRRAGVPVVSADALARDAVAPGSPGLDAVVEAFGRDVLAEGGALDREALRDVVFQDDDARERLEGILHPRIWTLRDRWMRERYAAGVALVVSEVPLLFEANLEADFHVTVVVDAPDDVRLARLTETRGLAREEAQRVMVAQLPSEEKRRRADRVLVNDGTLAELETTARALLEEIRSDVSADEAKAPAGGRVRMDLHMHTSASFDCVSDPEAVLAQAREQGIYRIAITDHNRLGAALALAEKYPDMVIPGEEVKTAEGIDVIGLYLKEVIPKGTPAAETCARVKAQGGLVYLPHPYAPGKGGSGKYAEGLMPDVDIVEDFNARLHPGGLNEPAEALAERWARPRGAGSDAHTVGEVGGGFVEVVPHANEPAALLEALGRSRVRGVTSPWIVHLASAWARVRKRVP